MSKGPWKRVPKKISKNMERLVGLYEQQLVRLNMARDLRGVDHSLYRFLNEFPKKTQPDDFTALDVKLWRDGQRELGVPESQIKGDLKAVRAFFYFLIDYLDYPPPNPVSERRESPWLALRDKQDKEKTDSPRPS